jgi:hypothetical protein
VTNEGVKQGATYTAPNGKTVTTSRTVTKTENGVKSTTTVTGPNGKTITRNGSVTVEKKAEDAKK